MRYNIIIGFLLCTLALSSIQSPAFPELTTDNVPDVQLTTQSTLDLPRSWIQEGVINGSMMYLADGDDGLRIVNITDPTNLTTISVLDTGQTAVDIDIRGTTAYVATYGGELLMINITTPLSPEIIGTMTVADTLESLLIDGEMLYINSNYHGMYIYNISSVTAPDLVSSYGISVPVGSLSKSQDYVFMREVNVGLQVINVSDVTTPQFVTYLPSIGLDVEVVGDLAYIANHNDPTQIMNISDIYHPQIIANISDYIQIADLDVEGDLLALNGVGFGPILYNISDPLQPQLLDTYTTNGFTEDVIIVNSTLYFLMGEGGITVFNITDPTLTLLDSYDPPSFFVEEPELYGTTLILPDLEDGLLIYNLSDPAAPQLDQTVTRGVNEIFMEGNRLYALFSNRVAIYNSSDLSTMTEIGSIPGSFSSGYALGHLFYGVLNNGTLAVYDIAMTYSPVLRGSLQVLSYISYTTELVISGSTAYLLSTSRGLFAVDVSDPASMSILYEESTNQAYSLKIYENLMFVSDPGIGVTSYDISNPAAIKKLGTLSGPFWRIDLQMPYLFVAAGGWGLEIVDVSDPSQMTLITDGSAGEWLHGVTTSHNLVVSSHAATAKLVVSSWQGAATVTETSTRTETQTETQVISTTEINNQTTTQTEQHTISETETIINTETVVNISSTILTETQSETQNITVTITPDSSSVGVPVLWLPTVLALAIATNLVYRSRKT